MAAFRNDGILQWRDSARLANLSHRRSVSRKSRSEYNGEKRRVYAKSGKAKRSRILDEVCETLSYTRKYAINLLTGNIRYRVHILFDEPGIKNQNRQGAEYLWQRLNLQKNFMPAEEMNEEPSQKQPAAVQHHLGPGSAQPFR